MGECNDFVLPADELWMNRWSVKQARPNDDEWRGCPSPMLRTSRRYLGCSILLDDADRADRVRWRGSRAELSRNYFGDGDGFDGRDGERGTAAANCVTGSFHFGNEGRNSLVGPNFRQFDLSIFKNTAITERLKLELRLEAYNLFNHPNFANPYLPAFIADAAANGISDGTGGLAIGRSLGSLPLTTTGDVGIGYPFLGSGGPRTMQLAAKFTF
jgi:hypothetical protein